MEKKFLYFILFLNPDRFLGKLKNHSSGSYVLGKVYS